MFDHESSAVRAGIEFLEQLLEIFSRGSVVRSGRPPGEARGDRVGCAGTGRELVANLPYEAIDDDAEREHQHPDMFDARKAERRKEARKLWLQVLLVLVGIALALLLIAISSD